MQDPASSHDDLSELERQLAALAPIGRVDRDRLMYAAGRRAGQRRLRATQRWLAVTSAGFGAMLAVAMLNPLWSVDGEPDSAPAIAQRPVPEDSWTIQSGPTSNDPNANYRLLKQLAAGSTVEAAGARDARVTPDAAVPNPERGDSRWLLNRYLDDPRTRL